MPHRRPPRNPVGGRDRSAIRQAAARSRPPTPDRRLNRAVIQGMI